MTFDRSYNLANDTVSLQYFELAGFTGAEGHLLTLIKILLTEFFLKRRTHKVDGDKRTPLFDLMGRLGH